MQCIFFDVDGVLVRGFHHNPEYRVAWDKTLEQDFGLNRQAFASNFFNDEVFGQVLKGKRELKEALSVVLPSLNCNVDPQDFIDYWLKKDSNVNHELFEIVAKLAEREDVKLYIATNQAHERADYLMNRLGFNKYFIDIFHSAKVGQAKPAREYFEYIDRELKLSQYEKPAIFFDDTPTVVAAAKDYGWQAFEFLDCKSLKQSEFF